MKITTKLALVLTAVLPLAACSENQAANGEKGAGGAMSAMTAKLDDLKSAATKMFDGQLGDATKSIDELKSKAAALTGDKKTEVEGLLKAILAKKDDVMKMIGDLKGLTDTAGLDGMKGKIGDAMAALKKMIEDAMAKAK